DEAQPPARQLPKTANAFGVAARQDKSLVAVDEPDQPVAPRVKQAPERREIARLAKARSDVEACGIDPAGRELLESVQTPHESKVERQRPRVRQRLAQRSQRQIVTRCDREPNAGRGWLGRTSTRELKREPRKDAGQPRFGRTLARNESFARGRETGAAPP